MEFFTAWNVFVAALALFLYLLFKRVCLKKELFIEAGGLSVFISGCDTGLGNRLAIYFDSLGCHVYAGCLNPASARETLPESVTVVPLDVCDEDSVQRAADLVKNHLEEHGKELWALINNAGICIYGEFEWQTWNQCQRQVDVNLLGTMRLTKACIPLLRMTKGRIITVTSVNGSISYPGLSVYSATKFALEGLCHAIRLELGRLHGIKVIIVEPGDLARLTSIMARHEKNAEEMWNHMPQEDQEKYGDFFQKYQRVTMKNYGLTSPPSLERSPLLPTMKHALLSQNPPARYIATGFLFRVFYQFLALMPFWLIDAVLTLFTDKLFSSDTGN